MVSDAADSAGVDRPTLSLVAEQASVSISTVSKVLNGRSGVSMSTRSRVEELLRDHRYNRRGTTQPTATLIEVVFQSIDDAYALEIISGVERIASEHGLSVVLTTSGDLRSPAADWIEGVKRRMPAGVILIFSDLSADHKHQLRLRRIPFVILDPAGDPAPDVPSIGSANWSGGYLAARHLLDLGHRDIAIITGPGDMLCSTARLSGYRAALDAAGIAPVEGFTRSGAFRYEAGVERGRELLEARRRPTAIFAGNDMQALGVFEAARRLGIVVPAQLSVVGYDDLPLARWAGPPLTTVRQPLVQMAEEATRLVIRLRTESPTETARIDLATRLVVRDSTAAPSPVTKLS